MKKAVSFVLTVAAIGGMSFMTSCKTISAPPIEEEGYDYDNLYRTTISAPFPVAESGETNRASYGYTLMSEQGYNGWSYLYSSGGQYSTMTYSHTEKAWLGNGAILREGYMLSTIGAKAVRKFEVTRSGSIKIYGNYKASNAKAQGGKIEIFQNNRLIHYGNVMNGDTVGVYMEIDAVVETGDILYFTLEGADANVFFNPVITYENSQDKSMYQLNGINKQWGDVFPFYSVEHKKMYMTHLWSDDAHDKYTYTIDASENMLQYVNIPVANNYETYRYVDENYRLNRIMDVQRFIDRSKYTFGVRDNFLYFDEEKQRYILIAGCYYNFDSSGRTSDLVIYISDDKFGLSWTKPGNVVAGTYSGKLPECPSLFKIGDRWYAFVSVAYNTVHQVGPLQYWTGESGVDVADVVWKQDNFRFLDGEDLCAARPTWVGDKLYMWGWIPSTYDTMPWSPWGGYLNLPREVIQHADGSLGGRLDPGLSKLLNYGNVYTMANDNFTVKSGSAIATTNEINLTGNNNLVSLGNFKRNYITFNLDMKNSQKAGYVMIQDGRHYQVIISKEAGKTYLLVTSPNDQNHQENSRILIGNDTQNDYEVKIVNDGQFVEFFVNDSHALTAHTAMTSSLNEGHLFADKEARFSNVSVNKLLSYNEVIHTSYNSMVSK